jgi:uncharacterized protein YcnI
MRRRTTRAIHAACWAALLALLFAPAALAHVQVEPHEVAPGDSVRFEVLVPGEREQHMTRLELQLPDGVHATAFAEVAGWTREVVAATDGSPERVAWSGDLAPDGFVEFAMLATTPDEPKDVSWAATQTYADGSSVVWSGAPDAETPAPMTSIRANAPRQNAGGELAGNAEVGPSGSRARNAETAPIAATRASEGDGLARGFGLAGLAAGLIALVVAVRRPRAHRSPR